MWISPRFNALYIHCPKTAGTSIRATFEQIDPGLIFLANHRTASQGRSFIQDITWDRLWKFSTCRHPCDQLVSHYCNIIRQPQHGYHARAKLTGFSEWLRWKETTEDNRGVCAHFIDLPLNFVMRFERLEADFAQVKELLGIETDLPIPRKNIANNRPQNWREWFTPADIDYVREQFREDFERFEYPLPCCDEAMCPV